LKISLHTKLLFSIMELLTIILNDFNFNPGYALVHLATQRRDLELIKLLKKFGADLNYKVSYRRFCSSICYTGYLEKSIAFN